MRKIAFGILLAGTLGGCAARPGPVAQAQPPAPAISPTVAAAAGAYAQMALSTGQLGLQSGQLALQTSRSGAVRTFARGAINDHAQLSMQLNAALEAAGLASHQVVMLPHHSAQLAQLQYSSGAEFDNAYRSLQIGALTQALEAHQRYASAGELPEVRLAAANALPVIRARLAQAQALSVGQSYRPSYRRSGERG